MSNRRKVFVEYILLIGLVAVLVGTPLYLQFGPADQASPLVLLTILMADWWFAVIALIIAVPIFFLIEWRE